MAGKGTNIGIAVGSVITLVGLLFFATRVKATKAIQLYSGNNELIYEGPRRTAGVAMSSIINYLEIAYYYDDAAGQWVQILSDTMLEPGMLLNISVTANCVWIV